MEVKQQNVKLQVRDHEKTDERKRKILKGISFDVYDGEFLSVLG